MSEPIKPEPLNSHGPIPIYDPKLGPVEFFPWWSEEENAEMMRRHRRSTGDWFWDVPPVAYNSDVNRAVQ